jgi:hypothetical protein
MKINFERQTLNSPETEKKSDINRSPGQNIMGLFSVWTKNNDDDYGKNDWLGNLTAVIQRHSFNW